MIKLNIARIVWVGLLIGVVLNVIGIIGNNFVLRDAWLPVAANLRPPQTGPAGQIALAVVGLLSDFVLAWAIVGFYAAVKSGLGPGWATAAKVAGALWVVGVVMPYTGLIRLGIIPLGLAAGTSLVALFSFLPAVGLAVKLYRDPKPAQRPGG